MLALAGLAAVVDDIGNCEQKVIGNGKKILLLELNDDNGSISFRC